MNAYWGPGVANYRMRQTAARLSVRQGNTGRRVVSLLFIVMGGAMLAIATGLLENDDPMGPGRTTLVVALATGAILLGAWMFARAQPTVVVLDRTRGTLVVSTGPRQARRWVTHGLGELVEPAVEDREFTDGDVGHRLVLVLRSGARVAAGEDFVGGASAGHAAAAIRHFLGQTG
jgi:hypothetical protein